ncbi:hypothetical protein CRE_22239 [Caenorhabditis remanei]|uniref:Uncharacterized protein n=1 Tax=Caenorhabditis remanei TaxID=31234 RepID=E3NS92_CAERE|nr:hypothetical protein CRE_22239 [Caenorhabditis remanei]
MRGIRICLLLIVLPLMALQQSSNQQSFIDQMSNNPTILYEKYLVFTELKTLVNHAAEQRYMLNLNEVVRNPVIYANASEIGGEIGAKAVQNLKLAYRSSKDPESFISFLSTCLEFMKKTSISFNWLFFQGAIEQMTNGKNVSEFKGLLKSGEWNLPEDVLMTLGVFDEPLTTTPAITTTTIAPSTTRPPDNFVVEPLGLAIVNNNWNQESFYGNSSFLEMLRDNSSKYATLFFHSYTILDELELSKNDSYRINIVVLYIKNVLEEKVEGFDLHLEALRDLKENESLFRNMVLMGDLYYQTNGSEYEEIKRKYSFGKSYLFNYFDLLGTFYQDRFSTICQIIENGILQIKKFSDNEFNALLKFVKLTMNIDKNKRYVVATSLGKSMTDEECSELWSHWNLEGNKKEMIEVVKEMHENFELNSCGI